MNPYDVFDDPIASQGRLSSQWGLPGEDPDQSFPQETGYPGEIAGPNYLLEESQAGVYDQVQAHLFDFTNAFQGYGDTFGGMWDFLQSETAIDPGNVAKGEAAAAAAAGAAATEFYGPPLPSGYHPSGLFAPVQSTIRQGMRGTQVRNWQSFLVTEGHPIAVDGQFGPGTHRATELWQSSRGLEPDGIVWPATRAAMGRPPVPQAQQTPIPTYRPPPYHASSTPGFPPLDPSRGPAKTAENGLLTTRRIAIALLGLSVVGTLAVVAFSGEKNEPGLAW